MEYQHQSKMMQKALKTIQGGDAKVVDDIKVPEPPEGYILAETRAVALNPTDYKHMRHLSEPGATLGCDWSGVIVKVGKNVTKFKSGDEVCGVCHGGNASRPDDGAFSQNVLCAEFVTYHKPANVSFAEAATFGVALATIGQTMYYIAKLPAPSREHLDQRSKKTIFIYGGSSATGTIAIQFAKLSGLRVITTSSPNNFSLVKSRGADDVFSYREPEKNIPEIRAVVDDNLTYIFDCIGNDSSAQFCAQLLSSQGGHYHSVQWPVRPIFKELRPEDSVRATSDLAYMLLGESFKFKDKPPTQADPLQKEFAVQWHDTVQPLFDAGLLISHPADVRYGGLEDVYAGLRELETKGAPSGKKIVYCLDSI